MNVKRRRRWVLVRVLAAVASVLVCCSGGSSAEAQTVAVGSGLLEGVSRDGLTAFKGIPFARPPVGELRWRPPQPALPWSGVRAADAFGPACPQHLPPSFGADPPQSEDCLYLNVWAPEGVTPRSRLPVMVWIFGGLMLFRH